MTLKSALTGAVLALLMSSGAALATETHCKGNEVNLKIVQDMTDRLFNTRDISLAPQFYAPEIVSHNVGSRGGEATVPVSFMQKMWTDSKAALPERILTNDLIVCADDIVTVRLTMTGASGGPDPKRFSTTAIDIYRLKDGKVVEWWGNSDIITMMRQLGQLESLVGPGK